MLFCRTMHGVMSELLPAKLERTPANPARRERPAPLLPYALKDLGCRRVEEGFVFSLFRDSS